MRIAWFALAAGVAVAGCQNPVSVQGEVDHSIEAMVGSEIDIRLQSIGPGDFAAPPTISTNNVKYVSAHDVGPAVPAGATQQFTFRALARGVAIVAFVNPTQNVTVEDTITVR